MKLPEPQRMTSGNYYIRMRLGGKNVNVTASSKKECIDKARMLKAEHKAGQRIKDENKVDLGTAIDRYIQKRESVLSPSTIRGYKGIRKNRFQAYTDKRLDKIDWQDAINQEVKSGTSAKTIKNAWGLIVSVLMEEQIDVPNVRLPQIILKEKPWLTPEQTLEFIAAVKGTPIEIPALIELHGLRRSEAKALDWDRGSIDLENEVIHVSGAVVQGPDQKFAYKAENKTASSKRNVPIMIPRLTEVLKDVENKHGPVITQHPNSLHQAINRICKANKLPEVGNHGLRYSFASLAYHLGWSERKTMEIGGWSDPTIMHKIYIKISQADKDEAANTMREFFKNAN